MTRSSAWPYNSPAWRRVRLAVLNRDGWVCQIRGPRCEVQANQADHVIPWRVGGAIFDPDNLRAACGPCNAGRAYHETKRRPSREW